MVAFSFLEVVADAARCCRCSTIVVVCVRRSCSTASTTDFIRCGHVDDVAVVVVVVVDVVDVVDASVVVVAAVVVDDDG